MKNLLILGGLGFMGKNLNIELRDSTYNIFNESRRTGCDLLDISVLKNKLEFTHPDIIINAAAHVGSLGYVSKYAATVVHDNAQMYLNLYKAVSEVDPTIRIINPISNCSYPGIIDVQSETEWWDGDIHESVMSYGNPKKLGYITSKCYEKQYGIKTLNFIMANSYGPNDYIEEEKSHAMNGIIKRMISAQKNKQPQFTIWGTGTPIREWVYMPDVAKFIKHILDNEMYNIPNPINIAQKCGVSIKYTADLIREMLQYDVEFKFDTTKEDGAPVKILNNELFNTTFPDFKFTGYDEGIKTTIDYYKGVL